MPAAAKKSKPSGPSSPAANIQRASRAALGPADIHFFHRMESPMPLTASSTCTTLGRELLTLFSAGFPPSGGAPGTYTEVPVAPPPKKSNFWLWLLGGVGCAVLLCVGCCGGMPFFGLYFGNKVIAEALKREVQGDPQV